MSTNILFKDEEAGSEVLIEVDEHAIGSGSGITKAGLADAAGRVVSEASAQFKAVIGAVVRTNVDAFHEALSSLTNPPSSAEVSFSLKATGEIGNFLVSKVSTEGNFAVKLTWQLK